MNFQEIFKHWRGDTFGGITAGIVALPLALAFGAQTELGAEAGLYGAFALATFAAMFGGTNTQISGPTGPMTVVSISVILSAIALAGGKLPDGSIPEAAMSLIIATFVMAGVIEFLFGVFGLGKYIKYMPYPVVSGFMSGIGFIIIFLQVFPFFGYTGEDAPKSIIGIVTGIGLAIENMNLMAVVLALITIGIIYLFPRLTKAVPSTLVALILVSLGAFLMKLDVPLIGDIPSGLPSLQIGTLLGFDITNGSYIAFVLEYGFVLAGLGAIDSLLTSVVADNLTKTKHHSNRELRGQGIGNIISGLIGGLPGAGATMRTVVNANSGGVTRLSGVISGLVLLVVLLGLSSLAYYIPLPVLAGILITVGIGIIDYKGLSHLRKIPVADGVVMIVVLLMTVFWDLLWAVGIGMVMASVLFMKKMGDLAEENSKVASLEELAPEIPWEDEGSLPAAVQKEVFIKHLEGPLFFGSSNYFKGLVNQVKDVRFVVIRMEKVPYIDQSGLYAFEDSALSLETRGIQVLLSGLQVQARDQLERINMIPGLISEEHIFENFDACAAWLGEHAPAAMAS